jgi:hypothetical protein
MHYLVIDRRFPTPIFVFLELDPRGEAGFPDLAVRRVTLEPPGPPADSQKAAPFVPQSAIGRDPWRQHRYREFASDRSAAEAGFILIEPRYVGPDWSGYVRTFRPDGEKPHRRPRPAAGFGRPAR